MDREFVAAIAGLDRSRWPVQPLVAETAIREAYEALEPDDPKPCVWVDGPDMIAKNYRETAQHDSLSIPDAITNLHNYTFPGTGRGENGGLDRFWRTNDEEAINYLSADSKYLYGDGGLRDHLQRAYIAGGIAVMEYRHVRFVVSRPMMRLDDQGRLHHPRKPALSWFGGPNIYYLHGVQVEDHIVNRSRPILIEDIHDIDNMEVRRVVIERFGWKKFLKAIGAWKVDEDKVNGVLWQANAPPGDIDRGRPMRLLELKDPSTNRKYFIRVPPNRSTALSARAWTFNKPIKEFRKLIKET